MKRNTSGAVNNGFDLLPSGIFRATNIQASLLVRVAFDVSDQTMTGAPDWLNSDRYDIAAKAAPGLGYGALRPLLRSLLASEFKLTTHTEPKVIGAYVLTMGKTPSKLQAAAAERAGCVPVGPQGPDVGGRHVQCGNMTMAELAHTLPNLAPQYINQPVVDQTGLAENYDFKLDWMPANQVDASGGFTLFASIERLGLKLESKKVPVPVLVIDHIEKPMED